MPRAAVVIQPVTSLAAAIRYDEPEKLMQVHGKTSSFSGRRQAVFFAHGVGPDDSKDDIRRYLQQIDKGLQDGSIKTGVAPTKPS